MNLYDFHLALPISDPTWVFFLVLIIILFAPMILGRLRIPPVIGLILAGVLIGDHGFHVLNYGSSFELFGRVGLYYIMLLAGLEINMEDFKRNRKKSVVFGLLTFFIPMVIGIWTSMQLLGYGLTTAVLLASMYASHTLISYPIISRYGLARLRSVNIAIGGTAITVTLALLILAIIAGMNKREVGGDLFWLLLLIKVVLLSAFIIVVFPRLGRWFFRRYDDSVMQFVFVLALVFLGGALMEFAGVEGILGAFLSGLVLNRLIPHVSPLMSRLEIVGNALFIPYFLIGVGMIIDIRGLFGGGEVLKVALVMTAVAISSKWLAAWITQHIYHMQSNERSMLFGLSNAQAAATLAAVLIGHNIVLANGERLLNDDVMNGSVVMILATCVISPFITERSARRFVLAEASQREKEEAKKKPEKILVPIANPDTIEDLISLALVIKDPKRRNALVALNVINDSNTSEKQEQQGKRNLEKIAMIAASANVSVNMVSRYDLNIASGIIHAIKEHEITDVVIGLHRKANLVDSFFGYLTENLLKGTYREVMIARFLMPVNTLRRVNVVVPDKAEFETGFAKWVEHVCRIGRMLGCRVHFFANELTLKRIELLVKERPEGTATELSVIEEWTDFLSLSKHVNYDHLLVVVSVRRGSVSYDSSFERIPTQIGKYFSNNNLIVLYPEQRGRVEEPMTFSNPCGANETQHYERVGVGQWFNKWLGK